MNLQEALAAAERIVRDGSEVPSVVEALRELAAEVGLLQSRIFQKNREHAAEIERLEEALESSKEDPRGREI